MNSSCIPSRGEWWRHATDAGYNLRPDGPLGSYADFTFTLQSDTAVNTSMHELVSLTFSAIVRKFSRSLFFNSSRSALVPEPGRNEKRTYIYKKYIVSMSLKNCLEHRRKYILSPRIDWLISWFS